MVAVFKNMIESKKFASVSKCSGHEKDEENTCIYDYTVLTVNNIYNCGQNNMYCEHVFTYF